MIPVKIVYPLPCENIEAKEIFWPFAKRFVETYLEHQPGHPHTVIVVINGPELTQDIDDLFSPLPVEYKLYQGNGMDLGSQQLVAEDGDHFQVNMTSRMYFHREGWLRKLAQARDIYGPGLYGMTASHEGGKFHICTRGHCYDSKDFREYPHKITSRDQGVFFECGDGCLTDWYKSRSQPMIVVEWGDIYGEGFCNHCGERNSVNFQDYFVGTDGFRNGDQRNVLCFDKHTDAFRDADTEEKKRLTDLWRGSW
jgi:hypothetical protein